MKAALILAGGSGRLLQRQNFRFRKFGRFAYCLNLDLPDYRIYQMDIKAHTTNLYQESVILIYRIISISIVAHTGTLCRAYDSANKHVMLHNRGYRGSDNMQLTSTPEFLFGTIWCGEL